MKEYLYLNGSLFAYIFRGFHTIFEDFFIAFFNSILSYFLTIFIT